MSDFVDWRLAEQVSGYIAGTGPTVGADVVSDVRSDFREFTTISDDLVRSFTGLAVSEPSPEPLVLDRAGWVRANLDSFSALIRPLAEKITTVGAPSGFTRRITSAAVGVQVGVLLGYLSKRVLGQYDLVLATEAGGRVYFVGPNVIEAERRMLLVPRDFRFWITLHEITHRTQFTGVPWLREKVRSLIGRSIDAIDLDPERVRSLINRARELLTGGPAAWKGANVMTLLMSEHQREIVREMQALMTVVEGHGTFVMNRIGAERIRSFEQLHHALESRRASAGGPERVFQRAIGMDMKYEQYSLGERFMNQVADIAGTGAVNKVWEREENLPSLEDLRMPEAWLRRVGG